MQKDLSCLPTPGCPGEMSLREVLSYSSPQALLHASVFLHISPFDLHSVPFSLICLPDYCVSPQLLVLQLPAPLQRLLRFGRYQSILKGRPGWESVCQRALKGVSERDQRTQYFTPIYPFPAIPRRPLLCPLPIPLSQHCSQLLCHPQFSAT